MELAHVSEIINRPLIQMKFGGQLWINFPLYFGNNLIGNGLCAWPNNRSAISASIKVTPFLQEQGDLIFDLKGFARDPSNWTTSKKKIYRFMKQPQAIRSGCAAALEKPWWWVD